VSGERPKIGVIHGRLVALEDVAEGEVVWFDLETIAQAAERIAREAAETRPDP
jgi:hypothetical protein